VRKGHFARIAEIEVVEVPSGDNLAAFGWIAHTQYLGAFNNSYGGRGLRVRSGNLQIGDESLLASAFPEERFNLWSIGEFHIFDPRLRPNARRDAFEPSVAVDDLFNQIAPYGNAIAKRCRMESKNRRGLRQIDHIERLASDVERVLHRNGTPLADAIRQFIAEQLQEELEAAKERTNELDMQNFAAVKQHVQKLGSTRRKSRQVSSRDLGRLDFIKWLHESGHISLIPAAITAACRRKARKIRTSR
jgi:molecular chaperone HtpG